MDEIPGPAFYAIAWSLVAASGICSVSRILVKGCSPHRRFWWDDYALLMSWVFFAICTSLVTFAGYQRLRHHDGETSNQNQTAISMLVLISTVFSSLATAWSKTSAALFTARVSSGIINFTAWAIIISLNLVFTVHAIVGFTRCSPPEKVWKSDVTGVCWDDKVVQSFLISIAAYSATMNLFLILLPLSIVMRLQLRLAELIGLVICICLGVVACVTAVMRCIDIPTLWTGESVTRSENVLFVWVAAEIAATTIAVSIIGHWSRCPGGHTAATGCSTTVLTAASRAAKNKYYYQRSDFDGTFKSKVHAHTTTITARKDWRFSRAFGAVAGRSKAGPSNQRDDDASTNVGKRIHDTSTTVTPTINHTADIGDRGQLTPKGPPFLTLPSSKHSSMSTLQHILAITGAGGSPVDRGIVQVNTITINYDNRSVFSDGSSSMGGPSGSKSPGVRGSNGPATPSTWHSPTASTWHAPTALAPPPARSGAAPAAVSAEGSSTALKTRRHHRRMSSFYKESDSESSSDELGDADEADIGKLPVAGVTEDGDLEMGPLSNTNSRTRTVTPTGTPPAAKKGGMKRTASRKAPPPPLFTLRLS